MLLFTHAAAQIDSLLTEGATKPVFSSQNHTAATYTRSTTCWAKTINLSGVSPWNSNAGVFWAGTLISPRHVIFAAHAAPPNGSTIRFVAMDGTVVNRTLSATVNVGGDILVGVLSSDVPGSISFAKLLPASASPLLIAGTPLLAFDQEENALVTEFYGVTDNYGLDTGGAWINEVPSNPPRSSFYEAIVSGDSGNPAFIIVHGAPVLVTAWTYGGPGAGPAYHLHLAAINAAMTSLGGGYQVTTIDLSEFTP